MFEVDVDLTDWDGPLQELESQVGGVVDHALQEAMTEAADRVKHSSKYRQRTGAYAASVQGGIEGSFGSGNLVGYVRAEGPVAEMLEHGTRPHLIVPKSRRALSWPSAAHPVRRVHHPGTKALNLIAESITPDEVKVRLDDAVRSRLGK